jgi:hypothetical protein
LIKALLAACEGQDTSGIHYIIGVESMEIALGKLDMRVVDGMGKLLFEIAKGTSGLLHSRGEELIGLVVKYTSSPPIKAETPSRSAEGIIEALGIIALDLCGQHTKPGKGEVIVDCILQELNKQLKSFSSNVVAFASKSNKSSSNKEGDDLKESALALTHSCSSISRLCHVLLVLLDRQDALILRSSPSVEDQLSNIVSLLASLVCSFVIYICFALLLLSLSLSLSPPPLISLPIDVINVNKLIPFLLLHS